MSFRRNHSVCYTLPIVQVDQCGQAPLQTISITFTRNLRPKADRLFVSYSNKCAYRRRWPRLLHPRTISKSTAEASDRMTPQESLLECSLQELGKEHCQIPGQ